MLDAIGEFLATRPFWTLAIIAAVCTTGYLIANYG